MTSGIRSPGGSPPGGLLQSAIELAAAGWPVLPLYGKRPYTEHGVHDATTDYDVIARWWDRWPMANVGASVPASLVCLDVDPRNGGNVASLGPLPATLMVWSGRGDGGQHLYFFRPPMPLSATGLPGGIDLKLNGYCVMPPSIHPDSGEPYRWEERPPAALPSRLRELMRPISRPTYRGRIECTGRALVDFVARQQPGNRNNALFWAACRAVDDGVLDALADDLVEAAVSVGESEAAAWATIESARRGG